MFGNAVKSFDGVVFVAAANYEGGTGSVFTYSEGVIPVNPVTFVFTETEELQASNGASGDLFGSSVAFYGDFAVVGADGTSCLECVVVHHESVSPTSVLQADLGGKHMCT